MPGVAAFDDLVHAVLGDLVDAEAVAKMGPDPSSVHVQGQLRPVRLKRKVAKRQSLTPEQRKQRQEMERKVAQVSNVVGLGAGVVGTGAATQAYRQTKRTGATGPLTGYTARKLKVSGKTAARLGVIGAGSALGLQAANVGGDVVTARVLGRSGVEKGLIPLHRLKSSRLASVMNTMGLGGKHGPSAPAVPKPGKHRAPKGGPVPAAPSIVAAPPREGMSTGAKAGVGAAATLGVYSAGKAKGQENAYYGKRDEVDIAGTFSKFDDDKKRAYGWASVVTMNGEPVIDRQGDYIGLDDIEEAAYTYVRKSRVAGDMHRRTTGLDGVDAPHRAGELIESVVFTPDKCHAMGLPASFAGKWWMGVQVEDDAVWAEVKKGNRTGFSIHGKGLRKDTTLDEIRSS